MQVRDAMSRHVTVVSSDTSVLAALRILHREHIRHLPVIDGGELVGIVSDRDLTPATRAGPGASRRGRTVQQVMTGSVRWTRPEDDLVDATRQLLDWSINALPVVELGEVVGILTTTDCLHAMLELATGDPAPSDGA